MCGAGKALFLARFDWSVPLFVIRSGNHLEVLLLELRYFCCLASCISSGMRLSAPNFERCCDGYLERYQRPGRFHRGVIAVALWCIRLSVKQRVVKFSSSRRRFRISGHQHVCSTFRTIVANSFRIPALHRQCCGEVSFKSAPIRRLCWPHVDEVMEVTLKVPHIVAGLRSVQTLDVSVFGTRLMHEEGVLGTSALRD